MSKQRTVESVVEATEQAEGQGARVRRAIGGRHDKFNPFLLFDHFKLKGSNGFPDHPHKGQETITYLLKGKVAHEDFTGSKGALYPGDLQFMTAGKGIVHSEMPVPSEDGTPVEGIQLWVDLPKELKETEPRYRDLREWEIPEVVQQNGDMKVRVISGKSYGVESIKELAYTPVDYYFYTLKPGANFKQELNTNFNYLMYVLNGKKLVLGEKTALRQYQCAFFNRDGDYITGVNQGDDEVQFVLVGGIKLDQEIVQYGPFVGCDEEFIQDAFVEYQTATKGFTQRRGWSSKIANGVTNDMVEGHLDGTLEKRLEQKEAYLAAKAKAGESH